MDRFNTYIPGQTIMLNGQTYTAGDARADGKPSRLQALFHGKEGENSFLQDLADFLAEWFNGQETVRVHTSGSTGTPKGLRVEKQRMMYSAMMTVDFLHLQRGDTALLCMPLQYIAGKMVVVRALVSGLNLVPVPPCGHPLAHLSEAPVFAALIPMQVYNSLQDENESRMLMDVKQLIIGGGPVDEDMAERLKTFPNGVWSTYGMTETLSHIALRKLNGTDASEWYTPLAHVTLGCSDEGTLVINAPQVCPGELITNDIVSFNGNGQFRIIGRKDNIINTGGIKVQAEQVENMLRPLLPMPFMITSAPDVKFGERIVLLVERTDTAWEEEKRLIGQACVHLPAYWRPKQIIGIPRLPLTGTGKPDRATAGSIARHAEDSQTA